MKKTVLTFGVLSGAVSSLMMLGTIPFMHRIGFDRGLVVGYTAIVLSFLLVFFGIRSQREQAGGAITFGRGFNVGILITLISCLFYVATWQLVYFKLQPGFMDQWETYAVEKVRAARRHARGGRGHASADAVLQGGVRQSADQRRLHVHRAVPGRPAGHRDLRRRPAAEAAGRPVASRRTRKRLAGASLGMPLFQPCTGIRVMKED